jgi:hypothetical protein
MVVHSDEHDVPASLDVLSQATGYEEPVGAIHFNLDHVVHHVVHEEPAFALVQPPPLKLKQCAPVRHGKKPEASFPRRFDQNCSSRVTKARKTE